MNVFKKKQRQLTPAEVIQSQQNKISESFNMFIQLRNDVVDSVDILKDAKVESEKRKQSLLAQVEQEDKTIALAEAEINANIGLVTKIEEFIPQGVIR